MNKSDLKNGMIVTLRRGVERVVIGKSLVCELGTTNILENYNDDLTHMNNCKSEDIMKIEYGREVIWERTEWDKVQFGTKVRVWNSTNEIKQVGKFLVYDENTLFPFLVFIEDLRDTNWFHYCEIIKEEGE